MSAKRQLSCSLSALTAFCQLTLIKTVSLVAHSLLERSLSSQHTSSILCDVSLQPFSVRKLVLQPGMQLEVLLLTLLL